MCWNTQFPLPPRQCTTQFPLRHTIPATLGKTTQFVLNSAMQVSQLNIHTPLKSCVRSAYHHYSFQYYPLSINFCVHYKLYIMRLYKICIMVKFQHVFVFLYHISFPFCCVSKSSVLFIFFLFFLSISFTFYYFLFFANSGGCKVDQLFNRYPVLSRLSSEGCASHIIRNVLRLRLFLFFIKENKNPPKKKRKPPILPHPKRCIVPIR